MVLHYWDGMMTSLEQPIMLHKNILPYSLLQHTLNLLRTGPMMLHHLLQGPLTEGKGSVRLISSTNQLRLAHSYVENIIYICYQTSYLNEEVNCTEPAPSDSVPCLLLLNNPMFQFQLKVCMYAIQCTHNNKAA